jgi:hypothetical protein
MSDTTSDHPITGRKIVLMYVTPPGQDDFFIAMPLGIIYLAAILRQHGADVECCDERVCTEAEVEAYLRKAEILGLSALTPHVNRAIATPRRPRRSTPTWSR